MQQISEFSDKLDSDFRSVFEDTGSLDCLEFLRNISFLGKLNSDNVFDYMKLFIKIKNGEFISSNIKPNHKSIILEKKICFENEEWFVHCRMVDIEGPYRVNRGTRIKPQASRYLQKSHNNLRNELIINRILIRDENKLVFSSNYEFNSLSAAASVICGANHDGWTSFRLAGTNQVAATLR